MKRIIINSLLLVGAFLLFLYGAVEYKTQYAKTEILTSDSQDGHKLIIYMIGEPEWPFGPTKGRMELYDESGKLAKRNYILYDDGCVTHEDNFEITWTEDSVIVKVMAEEQNDVYYQLYFDGKVKSWQEEALHDLSISSEENEKAKKETLEVMESYIDLMPSSDHNDINESSLQDIQSRISQNGNSIILPGVYKDMANYENFEQYLSDCAKNSTSSVILYRIHDDGGLTRCKYIYDGNDMYLMTHTAGWEGKKPQIYYSNFSKIKDWNYSENGWFGYELCVNDSPELTEEIDGCEIIRIKPFDKETLKWTKEVVAPVGYHGINILYCNWDKENMEEINFDACFEYFYFMKMGKKVDLDKYEEGIPERIYEDVLLTYLPIDADTLRKHAKYDRKKNIYEYSKIGYMNSSPRSFETSIPEVIEVVNLGDQKYKLMVKTICGMQYHDEIFTHALIVKKVGKNSYQYLSNMIIQDDRNILGWEDEE